MAHISHVRDEAMVLINEQRSATAKAVPPPPIMNGTQAPLPPILSIAVVKQTSVTVEDVDKFTQAHTLDDNDDKSSIKSEPASVAEHTPESSYTLN
jgi:hypothetical protein